MAVKVDRAEKSTRPVIIPPHVVARPPARTPVDIDTWRRAIVSAEREDDPQRTDLYDLYAEVELDPHLSRQWEKRVENITNTHWLFVNEKGEEVPELTTLMDTLAFEAILKEMMKSISYGISVIELGKEMVEKMGELTMSLTHYSVPRKHIRPEFGVIVKHQYDSRLGSSAINYREGAYINYCAEIGEPKSLGILKEIAPYVILKKGGVADWALFVQLFGQPFREYKYDGFNETTRIMLEKSAQEMASAPYIILPDGAQIQLHEIRNNNTGEVHGKLTEYCDKMISIRILGNTLTTDAGKVGSLALGTVHSETQDEVYSSDKQTMRRALNDKVLPILYNLGLPVKGGKFIPKEEKNPEKTLKKLEVYKKVKELGEPVDSDSIYEVADIIKPKDYDKQKSDMEAKASAEAAAKAGIPAGRNNKKIPAKKLSFMNRLYDSISETVSDFFE